MPGMERHQTPSAYERLVTELAKLPGIGRRSAQRIAFHLLRQPAEQVLTLADAIRSFKQDLKVCTACGNVTESDPCPICRDEKRDHQTILVVEQPSDIATIEQTGSYRGMYHVLMGRLAPFEGLGPGELNIDRLIQRVRQGDIHEIILGTNPTLEGDGTALYLAEKLEAAGVKVTRLARGMPAGFNLAQLSKTVLADAIQGRRSM